MLAVVGVVLAIVIGIWFEPIEESMDQQMLQQALDALARSTAAAESASAAAASAAASAAQTKTGGYQPRLDADPRSLRRPTVFNKANREEEAATWADWKRNFLDYLIGHHLEYQAELHLVAKRRDRADMWLEGMSEGTRRRANLLYGHPVSYLEGRLGRLIRQFDEERNGFKT